MRTLLDLIALVILSPFGAIAVLFLLVMAQLAVEAWESVPWPW